MKHIFLSYSRRDTEVMQQVRYTLRDNGFVVWTDEGIQPGTVLWQDSIQEAIEHSGCLIVILSPDAKNSEWVKRELDYSRAQHVHIFPLLARGDESNAIPFVISGTQFVDIRTEYEYGLQRLSQTIRGYLISEFVSRIEKQRLRFQELLDREGKLVSYRSEKVKIYLEKLQTFRWETAITSAEEAREALRFVQGKQEEVRQIRAKIEELIALYVEQQTTWFSEVDLQPILFEVIPYQEVDTALENFQKAREAALESFRNLLTLESDQYKPMRYMTDDLLQQMENVQFGIQKIIAGG